MKTAVLSATLLAISTTSAQAAVVPRSASFNGWPAVGALFPNASGIGIHTCSASVVASTTHDTIITSAHCVRGTGASLSFAPGYRSGVKPYGTWTAAKIYVDSRWQNGRNPMYDYAIVKLKKRYINGAYRGIQDATWGGYYLASSPRSGSWVTVPAYNAGAGDRPIKCSAPVAYAGAYPGFNCTNYNGGVSGAPFIQGDGRRNYVTGVIGGLHQGGCYSWTSYSAPFTSATTALLNRAQRNAVGDNVVAAGSDGC